MLLSTPGCVQGREPCNGLLPQSPSCWAPLPATVAPRLLAHGSWASLPVPSLSFCGLSTNLHGLESVRGSPRVFLWPHLSPPDRVSFVASVLGSSRSAPSPWLPSMTAPISSGGGGEDQISNQGVGLLPANWYRGYSSCLAGAVHERRKEQGIKMP